MTTNKSSGPSWKKRRRKRWSPNKGPSTAPFLPRVPARVVSLVAFIASPASCPVPLNLCWIRTCSIQDYNVFLIKTFFFHSFSLILFVHETVLYYLFSIYSFIENCSDLHYQKKKKKKKNSQTPLEEPSVLVRRVKLVLLILY
jgi:hypothetical protein